MTIRILTADDHPIVAAGIRSVIDGHDDLEIIGEARDGPAAVEQAAKLRPDVVIMDIAMPGLNGIEATRQIKEADANVKVLALTGFSHEQFVFDMLKAGASGYVLKDCLKDQLIEAIYAVHAGKKYLCSKAADILIGSMKTDGRTREAGSSIEKLTDKDCHMLKLVAQGYSSKETAHKLGISIKTVDGRKRKVMAKLELDGIADLTRFAIKQGLIPSDFER